VRLVLASLPEDQATAILLALRPGFTYREVAARLGEDPAVILRRLREGLRSLAAPTVAPTTAAPAMAAAMPMPLPMNVPLTMPSH
jgi:hypothetical protein